MGIKTLFRSISLLCGGVLFLGAAARAQQPAVRPARAAPRSIAYDAAHEQALEGTVVSFTTQPAAPPYGARLVLQTASGKVDVHLGGASFLQQNHFSLAAGDTLRLIGVNATLRSGGTMFLARVIQKGGQSLTLRTQTGIPLSTVGGRTLSSQSTSATQQGGAR